MKLVNTGEIYNRILTLKEAGYDVSYAEAILGLYVESENEWIAFRNYVCMNPGSVAYELSERKVSYDAIRNYFYNAFNGILQATASELIHYSAKNKDALMYLLKCCNTIPNLPKVDKFIALTPMMHTIYTNWLSLGTGDFDKINEAIENIDKQL